MKRIFSALAVALATLLVIGGDAVVNFGGAAASMTDAAPAVPLTIASVSALPTDTTEPSPETALFSGLLGAAALTAHPGGETAEDALLNNEDAAKAAAAQAAEEEPPQETPEADEAPVSTAVQALGVISGTGVRMRSGAGTGYDILKMATRGSARLLGRDDIGQLSVGKCADLFMIDSRRLELVGCDQDAGSVLGTVGVRGPVDYTVVQGRVTVRQGHLVTVDEELVAREANNKCRDYLANV